MTSMQAEVRAALEKFRRGDDETAFFELIEMPGDVLTGIIEVFHAEPCADVRAFLVKAAWERREETVLRFLAEALNDPAEQVWQQALDGLVAFSLPSSLKILQSARAREFTEETAAKRFNLWLEEAIQQVELERRSKV